VTCAVCDLAAIRAAHAYAIEWHTFKGETKEVIDAVPSLLDALVAARAREAALTAEVERLRDERANIDHVAVEADRFVDALMGAWADATPDSADAMDVTRRAMRSHLVRLHDRTAAMERDLAAARADAANARQIATEACDGWSAAERAHADTVEGEGYEFDRAGAEKPIATLRARLASPEPGADGAKET